MTVLHQSNLIFAMLSSQCFNNNYSKIISIKRFLVAKLLYKSKCPSVCQPRLGGNVIFSAPNWDRAPIVFVQILLVYEHIFYIYFVRRSGYKRQKSFANFGCCHPCFYLIFCWKMYWFAFFPHFFVWILCINILLKGPLVII